METERENENYQFELNRSLMFSFGAERVPLCFRIIRGGDGLGWAAEVSRRNGGRKAVARGIPKQTD